MTEENQITHFWVKAYDCYNRRWANPNHDDRDSAYREFRSHVDSGRFVFAQMGAMTTQGGLVLNEWRKPALPG